MKIEKKHLRWASYSSYEGPAFYGCGGNPGRYVCPENPTQQDKILAVITATEGGSWNLVNLYDRCKCTVGLIQWCESGMYAVSDMLGFAVDHCGASILEPIRGPMERQGLRFRMSSRNKWRFHFGINEVDTSAEQTKMFFLNASGKKGEWDAESREYVRDWAVGFANLYTNPCAIRAQRDFTVPRLGYFFTLAYGKGLVKAMPDTDIARAWQAAFMSFAANNPRWAEDNLKIADMGSQNTRWSLGWLVDCLTQWTHGPQCTIYPHRYNKIRPKLEAFYGIDLPDLAKDLSSDILDAPDIQSILVHGLGYDLGKSGPAGDGVDGKWGGKSKAALTDFQRRRGLEETGWPNAATVKALLAQNVCEDLAGGD